MCQYIRLHISARSSGWWWWSSWFRDITRPRAKPKLFGGAETDGELDDEIRVILRNRARRQSVLTFLQPSLRGYRRGARRVGGVSRMMWEEAGCTFDNGLIDLGCPAHVNSKCTRIFFFGVGEFLKRVGLLLRTGENVNPANAGGPCFVDAASRPFTRVRPDTLTVPSR